MTFSENVQTCNTNKNLQKQIEGDYKELTAYKSKVIQMEGTMLLNICGCKSVRTYVISSTK